MQFQQRGDGDGSKNETPGDPPDGEPPKESRLCPGLGGPSDLKEICLKGRAPVFIRRMGASQLGEALSFGKMRGMDCVLGRGTIKDELL